VGAVCARSGDFAAAAAAAPAAAANAAAAANTSAATATAGISPEGHDAGASAGGGGEAVPAAALVAAAGLSAASVALGLPLPAAAADGEADDGFDGVGVVWGVGSAAAGDACRVKDVNRVSSVTQCHSYREPFLKKKRTSQSQQRSRNNAFKQSGSSLRPVKPVFIVMNDENPFTSGVSLSSKIIRSYRVADHHLRVKICWAITEKPPDLSD
jgi:hypothetical protein